MPRKKGRGRLWGEAGAGYLLRGSNKMKVWEKVEQVLVGGLLWLNDNCW